MAVTPEVRATEGNVLAVTTSVTGTERTTQALTLTAINFPTIGERVTQADGLVVTVQTPILRHTQSAILVAILRGSEERILRAWTFTQDDHDFYVLIAASETYVYDKLTGQWCQWKMADNDAKYWRGLDGCDWNGINVCCDPDSGQIFQIDPVGRLDYKTTPITSIIYGGMTERFRNMTSAYFAEVAISQAKPPLGIDGTTVSLTLDSYDTMTWVNHGTVQGSPSGSPTYPRFYGLGLIHSPGVVFRITDTGYARRIDGLNVEVSGKPDGN